MKDEFFRSEKTLFVMILVEIFCLLLFVLFSAYLLRMQHSGRETLLIAGQLRYESYLLANQLRQSSDDLTRMVRSYVSTGDSEFEDYFWDILAIRDGKKPRPVNYERVYWDFMTVKKPAPPFADGEKVSLVGLMRKTGFTEKELQLLADAKKKSDTLVSLERIAMQAMKGKFQDEKGELSVIGVPDPEMARQLVFGGEYHEAKKNIMAPINKFLEVIDQRTLQTVVQASSQVRFYQWSLVSIFSAIMLNGLLLLFTTNRHKNKQLLVERLAAKTLRESEEKLRVVLDSTPEGIVILSRTGEIILANKQIESLFGYSQAELQGCKVETLIPERFRDQHVQHRGAYFESPRVRPMGVGLNLFGLHKEGREFPVEVGLSPVKTEQGLAAIVSIRDITERKRVEERLHRENERTALLLELYNQAPDLTDKELYDYVLDKAVRLTASTIGFFHLVAEDQKSIILTTWNAEALKNCTAVYDAHYPIEEAGNWVDCIHQSSPVIYNDFPNSPNQKGLPEGHTHLQRFMSIPVMEGEMIRYIFGVGNKEEEYEQHDVVQIQLIANELTKIMVQRRAAQALKESRQKFQRLVENLEDKYFFYSHGVDGVFTYVSPSLFNILGYMVDEYLKHYSQTLTDNPVNQNVEQYTAASLQGERQPPYLIEVYHQDGTKRWLEVSESPVFDDSGLVTAVEGLANDITERIEAEGELNKHREHLEELVEERTIELQESEETFRSITSSAQAGIIMINSRGNITFWNKGAEKMFGWSAAGAQGSPLHHMIIPKEFHEPHLAGLKKFQATGQGPLVGKTVEMEAVRRDNTKIAIELSLSAVNLRGFWHAIGILSDITDRKEAEAALVKAKAKTEEREANFRGLFEGSRDAIMLSSAEEGFVDCNDRTLEMFRCKDKAEFLGLHPGQLAPPTQPDGRSSQEYAEETVAIALKEGGALVEYVHQRMDGTTFLAEVLLSPVLWQGKPVVQGVVRDITERKEAEAELHKNMDELQRFSTMAMGREKEMVRLKEEINSLLIQLGKESKYEIVQ